MTELSGLTIRQHERQAIELDVELIVADHHRQQVRYSAASGAAGQAMIKGKAQDVSTGGMGLRLHHYVPKMCEGMVRVFGPTPLDTAADGSLIYDVIFEHRVKARRIYMDSHEPTYCLGVSFIEPEPDLESRVNEVLMVAGMLDRPARPEAGPPPAPPAPPTDPGEGDGGA